jgi:cobalt-zinc-cadmium resistance protein CzcA
MPATGAPTAAALASGAAGLRALVAPGLACVRLQPGGGGGGSVAPPALFPLLAAQFAPVGAAGGRPVPLGELADVLLEESPPSIEHENSRRRTFVSANVRGRDVAGFVSEAQRLVQSRVQMPVGYSIRWGGDFENLLSAARRLMLITPLVLGLIAMLLYTSFKSFRLAALIFFAVPVAASGGIAALAIRGMPFSIAAGVGFVALFGVAVLNGLVWVAGAEHARKGGLAARDAAIATAEVRIRPVLMTALVASLGFLPMAMATSAGAEIQQPLATVVIGGIVTSTLLTAFVVPAIYPWFAPRSSEPGGHSA